MYRLDSTELKADRSVLKYDSDPPLRNQDPTRLSSFQQLKELGMRNRFGGIGGMVSRVILLLSRTCDKLQSMTSTFRVFVKHDILD